MLRRSSPASGTRPSGVLAEIQFVCRSLRNPLYRRFALSSLVSVIGTWMQVVAQNWLVFHLAGNAAPVGITIMLQSLPSVNDIKHHQASAQQ